MIIGDLHRKRNWLLRSAGLCLCLQLPAKHSAYSSLLSYLAFHEPVLTAFILTVRTLHCLQSRSQPYYINQSIELNTLPITYQPFLSALPSTCRLVSGKLLDYSDPRHTTFTPGASSPLYILHFELHRRVASLSRRKLCYKALSLFSPSHPLLPILQQLLRHFDCRPTSSPRRNDR